MFAQKRKYLPFLMWLFPLSFFAYQFILRLWPGLMMQQTMAQFSIDARHFGLLAAFYYYGYAGMQIPVAFLLDRWSARSVIGAFALLCGFATLVFIYTDNFYVAVLSRFLIGAGSAVGFLGVSKVVSEWFPKEHYARMIGCSFTIGLMGAIYGGKPVSTLIETWGWQSVALMLSFLSITIGCVTYLFLRSPLQMKNVVQEQKPFQMTQLKALLSSPSLWCLALANLLMVGALEGFADVWGVPYLMVAHALTKGEAAGLTSFIFLGMLFGGPFLVMCSQKFGNYPVIAACGFGIALVFVVLFLSPTYNGFLFPSLLFMVGMMCCYQVIIFTAGAHFVTPENLGITIAFLNCVNMLGGSFFHTAIGQIINVFGAGHLGSDGLPVYSLVAYTYALSLIPLCAIVGAVMTCLVGLKVARGYLLEKRLTVEA